MSDFRKLTDTVYASPQLEPEDIAAAGALGVKLVINNRPEGESPDQTPGTVIEQLAREQGMEYLAIPITHAGFSLPQVEAMAGALSTADGPVLAYCRSGTRSTLLWALAQAKAGESLDGIEAAARQAGYDVSPVRPTMDMLASQSG